MKHTTPILESTIALVSVALGLQIGASAFAQTVPAYVNYQGRLSNPDGSPLATGDYQLTFKIYDSANSSGLVWGPQVFTTPVVQGYFNVILGPADTNGVSLAGAFNSTNRFVEVTVSNRPAILPRQQILTAPYAFQAGNAATAAAVGGQTAANVASATVAANAATSANTANAIVKRDGSGNFSAGTITANLSGNATTANSFSGSLTGDVTGTQGATVVASVGGQTASSVASGAAAANAATSANAANAIVRRDASGNFSAGNITAAAISGNGAALFGLNASQVNSGNLPAAQLPSGLAFANGRLDIQGSMQVAGLIQIPGTSTNFAIDVVNNKLRLYAPGGQELFNLKPSGNVGLSIANPSERLHVLGNILATGTITGSSDRNAKTDFATVDTADVLRRLVALPISQWRFKAEATSVKHLGPMAQDFQAEFGLGALNSGIATVDADGVALAAIQGLNQKLEERLRAKDAEIELLNERLNRLEAEMNSRVERK